MTSVSTRRAFSVEEKKKVIELASCFGVARAAKLLKIHHSQVSRWLRNRDKILAAKSTTKKIGSGRRKKVVDPQQQQQQPLTTPTPKSVQKQRSTGGRLYDQDASALLASIATDGSPNTSTPTAILDDDTVRSLNSHRALSLSGHSIPHAAGHHHLHQTPLDASHGLPTSPLHDHHHHHLHNPRHLNSLDSGDMHQHHGLSHLPHLSHSVDPPNPHSVDVTDADFHDGRLDAINQAIHEFMNANHHNHHHINSDDVNNNNHTNPSLYDSELSSEHLDAHRALLSAVAAHAAATVAAHRRSSDDTLHADQQHTHTRLNRHVQDLDDDSAVESHQVQSAAVLLALHEHAPIFY